jgi:hypothetical protein
VTTTVVDRGYLGASCYQTPKKFWWPLGRTRLPTIPVWTFGPRFALYSGATKQARNRWMRDLGFSKCSACHGGAFCCLFVLCGLDVKCYPDLARGETRTTAKPNA